MKNKSEKKFWRGWVLAVLVFWLGAGFYDFMRVKDFERPVFCILIPEVQDGGSGTYRGLGYSFDIEGNFMPEDEFPGVTAFTYYIGGHEVLSLIRD